MLHLVDSLIELNVANMQHKRVNDECRNCEKGDIL